MLRVHDVRRLLLVLAILGSWLIIVPATPAHAFPLNNLNCGNNVTGKLQTFLTSAPARGVITFPHDACYTVNGSITIDSKSNLTINFNGAIFNRNTDFGSNGGNGGIPVPMLWLTNDTNLRLSNLTLEGPWNGSSGDHGELYEGQIGLETQCDNNVYMNGINIEDTQGDAFAVQLPTVSSCGVGINKNITFTNGSIINAGYTGMSVEAVNGLTFTHNKITNVGENAIDEEVDDASSGFGPANSKIAYFAAQDNENISYNSWSDYNDYLFASLQGGSCWHNAKGQCNSCTTWYGAVFGPNPCDTYWAVQQRNINFTHNTITGQGGSNTCCELITIQGTTPGTPLTSAPGSAVYTNRFFNTNFTFSYNTYVIGTKQTCATSGTLCYGAEASGPAAVPCSPNCPSGSLLSFLAVDNVVVENNTLPTAYNKTFGPYVAIVTAKRSDQVTIEHNTVPGAYGSFNTVSARSNQNVHKCGNVGKVNGTTALDPSC